MKNKIPMIGKRFNRLEVIGTSDKKVDGKTHWICRCDCGVEKIVMGKMLRIGNTKSCGCLQKEKARISMKKFLKENPPPSITHGLSKSRIYQTWKNMHRRCSKPNTREYKWYGGRGITVCPKWNKFENFYEDMKEGYTDDLTIERIDTNGDYCKENCTWATMVEQSSNRRNNHRIKYKGKEMTVQQWADYLGVPRVRLNNRLCRGMKIKDVLNPNKMAGNQQKGCKYLTKNNLNK